MRLYIPALILLLAAPLCGQTVTRDTNYAVFNDALQNYFGSMPTRTDDGVDVIATTVINQDSGVATMMELPDNYITVKIDGQELTFNYLELSNHTLKAYSYFSYDTADCSVMIAEKMVRYNILNWPEAKWQSYVRKYNHGDSAVDDNGMFVTCDTVDRAVTVHTLESFLAVRTGNAWTVYAKPPEIFKPDWDMQYFFEQRYEQQRDKLMKQYTMRNR